MIQPSIIDRQQVSFILSSFVAWNYITRHNLVPLQSSCNVMLRLPLSAVLLFLIHGRCHLVYGFTLSVPASSTPSRRPLAPLLAQLSQDGEDITTSKGSPPKETVVLDEKLRNKLLAETIAPWRAVRLFAYGTLGGGALIGGVVALTSTAAVLAGARSDLLLSTCLKNLAIDFGGVAAFALLAKFDLDKKGELDQRVEGRVEKKKEQEKIAQKMKERGLLLKSLQVELGDDFGSTTRQATLRELQTQLGTRYHMIVSIGPKKARAKALIGAGTMKGDILQKGVLLIPYDTSKEVPTQPSAGFGDKDDKPDYFEVQPYVAKPAGDYNAWREYAAAEMEDAVTQNGEKVREEGIYIVVARNGKVIRRGVGLIPWRETLEELSTKGEVKM
jgi:hypothetical protein